MFKQLQNLRLLGTAVNLSTIIRRTSPLSALGWMESLKIGAGVGSVVKGHTTIESFAFEPVVLDDDRGSRLARISRAARDGPDLTAFHSAFQLETASMNAWSRLARGLFATASD